MRYTYMYIGSSMSWGHKQVAWRSWSNQMPMVSTTVNMLSTQSEYLQPHGVCPMIGWLRKRRLGFDLLVEFWILYKYLLEADRCGTTNHFWDNIEGHQWMEIFIVFKTSGIIHGHGVCLKEEMDRCLWLFTHSWAIANDCQGGEGLGKDVIGKSMRKAFEEEVHEWIFLNG